MGLGNVEAELLKGSSRREVIVTPSSSSEESGEANLQPPTPSKSRFRVAGEFAEKLLL